jgi:hypothetical protein
MTVQMASPIAVRLGQWFVGPNINVMGGGPPVQMKAPGAEKSVGGQGVFDDDEDEEDEKDDEDEDEDDVEDEEDVEVMLVEASVTVVDVLGMAATVGMIVVATVDIEHWLELSPRRPKHPVP